MRLHKLLIAMTAANLVLLAWRVAQLGITAATGRQVDEATAEFREDLHGLTS